jgi:hypothetical protein
MNPILRVLRMATEVTDRRYWMVIFLAILDFCCVLLALERYDKGYILVGTYWLIAGIALSLLGWKWPQIRTTLGIRTTGVAQPERTLPERPPHVLPTDYGKDDKKNSFGLFLRNPGYDATNVHIPSVSIGQSAYKLIFPETLPVLCERDPNVFVLMEAWLEDQTNLLPGLDGSRLHDVMRQADIELIKFPILYGGLDFPEYYTNCIIERVNWKHDGLAVREAGHGKGIPTP